MLLRWGWGAVEQRGRDDVVALRGGVRWARLDLGLRRRWDGRCGAGAVGVQFKKLSRGFGRPCRCRRGEIRGGELGRTRARRKEGMDPTRRPGRADGDALREGGDGLTGGANLAERGKRARLREERRRHVGPMGQTQSGDSGDTRDERLVWADMQARPVSRGHACRTRAGWRSEAGRAERRVWAMRGEERRRADWAACWAERGERKGDKGWAGQRA